MKRLGIAAGKWDSATKLGPADRYGLLVGGLALLVVIALLTWPLQVPEPLAPARLPAIDAGLADALIDNAPFDPLHRRWTSVAPLDAGTQQASSATEDTPFIIGGIMLIGDERQVMFSAEPGTWHREGETVRDWLIRHVEPETVIMTRGAEIMTLTYRAALESLSGAMPQTTQP